MIRERHRSLEYFRSKSIRTLANYIFQYEQSVADERFFRQAFYELAAGKRGLGDRGTFSDFLWHLIYERTEGHSARYLFFNERAQRLYVDWAFQAWAEKALDEINSKLTTTP